MITYEYTPSGKMKKITYQDTSTVSFAYDLRDNLSTMTDSIGTTTYTYNETNRIKSVADPHGFVVFYQYDAAGNTVMITYPGNKKVLYTYDGLNRMEAVTIDWLGLVTNYDYDETGRLSRVDSFNGTWTCFGYDNANRLTDVQNRKADLNAISAYHFILDDNGNRTFVNLNQTEPITGDLNPATTNYTYNSKKNRLSSAGSTSFTYDNEGQLTSKGSTTCTFDYEHRLKTYGSSYTYSYDGMGKLLKAVRSSTETRYIYDAAGNILAEANSNNVISRYYIYGQQGLLAMVTSAGTVYCYHFDGNGNTIAMTDTTQNVKNKYAYAPFGAIVAQSETVSQPFKFVGQHGVMTEANGLCYMRARFYDPTVGRFISEDPTGFSGGDVNLYVYVGNNPVLLIDPTGLAQFGKRPFAGLPEWLVWSTGTNSLDDFLNTELVHEEVFFEDGNIPASQGFYSDSLIGLGELRTDDASNISQYRMFGQHYDDALMRTAVENVGPSYYWIIGNNCQSWADSVRGEYGRLESLQRAGGGKRF